MAVEIQMHIPGPNTSAGPSGRGAQNNGLLQSLPATGKGDDDDGEDFLFAHKPAFKLQLCRDQHLAKSVAKKAQHFAC